jgi:hypothetical protein
VLASEPCIAQDHRRAFSCFVYFFLVCMISAREDFIGIDYEHGNRDDLATAKANHGYGIMV